LISLEPSTGLEIVTGIDLASENGVLNVADVVSSFGVGEVVIDLMRSLFEPV
jgi:hypothetical protein